MLGSMGNTSLVASSGTTLGIQYIRALKERGFLIKVCIISHEDLLHQPCRVEVFRLGHAS